VNVSHSLPVARPWSKGERRSSGRNIQFQPARGRTQFDSKAESAFIDWLERVPRNGGSMTFQTTYETTSVTRELNPEASQKARWRTRRVTKTPEMHPEIIEKAEEPKKFLIPPRAFAIMIFLSRFHAPLSKTSRIFLPSNGFFLRNCTSFFLLRSQREFVKFDNPYSYPVSVQSSPIGEYDSYELIDQGAPKSGIPPMYSQRDPSTYGVLVDGPRHSPYLSPQYRTLDLPYPMPPGKQIINQTDAPIIVRDGHQDRNNQIIMSAFD
jgi:hypothetical protein